MIKYLLWLSIVLVLYVFPAAAQTSAPPPPPPAQTVDPGELKGTNYVNNFFGMSLSVPRDWVVINAQGQSEAAAAAKKTLRADNESRQAQIDDSIERSKTLLALTKRPPGSQDNASFMLIAERIPSARFKTGADVIESMKSVTLGTNVTVEFLGDIGHTQIGGADFAFATLKNTSPMGTFMQKIYVTLRNGYGLQFVLTYLNEADVRTFDATVTSTKFK